MWWIQKDHRVDLKKFHENSRHSCLAAPAGQPRQSIRIKLAELVPRRALNCELHGKASLTETERSREMETT
jgi:hypothetical protein